MADDPGVLGTNAHAARTWSQCPLCRADIAPGQRVALPPGGSQYCHVACIAAREDGGDA